MDFLNSFFSNEDRETAREQIASRAAWEIDRGVITCRTGVSASRILTGLLEIEALLADPDTEPYVLMWLVEVYAGWSLTEPREEQAKDILQKIAESVREVFGDSHEQECRSRKRRH
jgi:hypothetical protein